MTTIPTQAEYHNRELSDYAKTEREINALPLAERKENATDFANTMRTNPALIAERIGWLINGSYGYASYYKARQVLAMNGNTNKPAVLCQMIALLEWRVPQPSAIKAWKTLTDSEKAALDTAIESEIKVMTAEDEAA